MAGAGGTRGTGGGGTAGGRPAYMGRKSLYKNPLGRNKFLYLVREKTALWKLSDAF